MVFERAKEVESATFKVIGKGEVNGDYRSKMRSLSLNLKDKKNPSLRENVVSGLIEAEKLVTMTPEEMASDEKKAEREALQMQNLFKAKAAAAQGESTCSQRMLHKIKLLICLCRGRDRCFPMWKVQTEKVHLLSKADSKVCVSNLDFPLVMYTHLPYLLQR